MARFLTVNDFSGSPPVPRGNQDFNLDPERTAAGSEFGVEPTPYGVQAPIRGYRNDQGPCLYFGPHGERCGSPAIANGFCGRHTPRPSSQPSQSPIATSTVPKKSRIVAVVLFALAILESLWPAVSDLAREILRWIHSH